MSKNLQNLNKFLAEGIASMDKKTLDAFNSLDEEERKLIVSTIFFFLF